MVLSPPEFRAVPIGMRAVFLAGSIAEHPDSDWRSTLISGLKGSKLAIFDPRRAPSHPGLDLHAYVEWELDALDRADLILMHFTAPSRASLTLMELGLHASSGKLIVCCAENYWRRPHVEIVCARYAIPMVSTLATLIEAATARS